MTRRLMSRNEGSLSNQEKIKCKVSEIIIVTARDDPEQVWREIIGMNESCS
jgi:hypothetical protein